MSRIDPEEVPFKMGLGYYTGQAQFSEYILHIQKVSDQSVTYEWGASGNSGSLTQTLSVGDYHGIFAKGVIWRKITQDQYEALRHIWFPKKSNSILHSKPLKPFKLS